MKKIHYLFIVGVALALSLPISCKQKTKREKTNSQTSTKVPVILVHSAWLGAWQWEATMAHLNQEQLNPIAVDLPGHGQDSTPPNEITMDNYVDHLLDIIDHQSEKVVLVGHSFNGINISRVAELRPDKIKKLIYVTAFLVPNGTSFFSAVQGVENSKAVEHFYLSEDQSYALVTDEEMHNAFAHDIPLETFNAAKPNIVPEPSAPLGYALEITEENFGKLPKYYIECTEDKAIPIAVQRAMYKGKVKKHFSLASSHTPNFSKPDSLAYYINKIILK